MSQNYDNSLNKQLFNVLVMKKEFMLKFDWNIL